MRLARPTRRPSGRRNAEASGEPDSRGRGDTEDGVTSAARTPAYRSLATPQRRLLFRCGSGRRPFCAVVQCGGELAHGRVPAAVGADPLGLRTPG